MTPLYLNPWLYIPAAAVALLALWLLYIALFRDRSHRRNPKPRCPKCWYDLSGALANLPITCPECGRVIADKRDLHRTRRKPLLAIIALPLLALLPALSYFRGDLHRAWYALPPKWVTVETIRVGVTVATLQKLRNPDDRGMRAVVRSNDGSILDVEDYDIQFGQQEDLPHPDGRIIRHGAGDDLNGDGIKDLVIFAYSGGAHCCYTVYVVELSDPPVIAATIDAGNGMSLDPVPTGYPHDNQVLFNIPDQSFCYWNAPNVSSPQPSVKYLLSDHRLRIAPEYTRLSHSTAQVVAKSALEYMPKPDEVFLSGTTSWSELNPTMWRVMLQLIYSGNEDAAWLFFDKAWHSSRPGKAAFKQEFLDILNKSPQYRDFKAALAAQAQGKPIPPALVGQYVPQSPADPPPNP